MVDRLPTFLGASVLPLCPDCGKDMTTTERQELKRMQLKDGSWAWGRCCKACIDLYGKA